MKEIIQQLAQKHLESIRTIRRYLHQHPELAHEEFETQKLVCQELEALGIDYQIVAGTGVLGIIRGAHPGRTVLLRADMDALPVEETAEVSYHSLVPGKMHACGHDGHTAGLIGAAKILNEIKADLHGNVKLMFQPAEETDGGALPMIEAGILENPKVSASFGLHLGGHLEAGNIHVKHGAMMGAPDEFEIEIIGRGGHAASPEQTIDPISLAVQFIQSAQFILTRRLDPVKPAVISFTTIHAGEGLNVIPETLTLGGTIRTLYPETRELIKGYIEETLNQICQLNGAQAKFNYFPSYPPLINDHHMTDFIQAQLTNLLGEERVAEMPQPSLGAEDFAYLAQAIPSSYYYVGIKEDGKPEPVHHHPAFAWNDDVLAVCSQSLAWIAYQYLNQE